MYLSILLKEVKPLASDQGSLNFKRIIPVFKKEFLHIIRDARSLAIVLIAPVLLIFLYSYAITFDINKVDFSVVDYDRTTLSRLITSKFTASGYFEMYKPAENNMSKSVEAIRINKVKLIVTLPSGLEKAVKKNQMAKVQVIGDGSDPTTTNVALGYANMIIASVSRDILLDEVKSRGFNPKTIPMVESVPRVWYNQELKSSNFIIPGLIAIIMMLIAALLTSLTVVGEKEKGTFEQLISTPIKPLELMIGKITPYIVICLIDVAEVVIVGILWFKLPFQGNYFTLVAFSLLFLFCALGLGLFISSISSSQQMAVIVTSFSTLLPSILLSGFMFPIDSMPWIIRLVTYIFPARYFITALRTIFLKADTGMSVLWGEAWFLFFFGMLFLLISATKFKKNLG